MNSSASIIRKLAARMVICLEIVVAVITWLSAALAFSQDAINADGGRARHVTVTGTVTDNNNQAVADAPVYLAYAGETESMRMVTTQTDAAGVWSFKLAHEPKSDLVVLVSKTGHALGVAKKDISSFMGAEGQIKFGETIDLPIQLGQPSRLTLQVVDDQGSPVEGARLSISGTSHSSGTSYFYWNEAHVPELSWETAADGNVTIDNLPASHTIGLLVETPQHGTQRIGIDVDKAASEIVVTLLPACYVEVALSSDDASLLNEREITIDATAARDSNQDSVKRIGKIRPWGGRARVRTDASGKASAVLPAGALSVTLNRRADDRYFAEAVAPVQAEAGKNVSLPIRFKPGTKLTGRVQTADGEPVADVGFRFSGSEVRSGNDGTFEIWVPSDQPINGQVRQVPDGLSLPYEQRIYLPLQASEKAAAAATERELPAVILRKSIPVTGRVIDETGHPVSGARVIASWVQQHESAGYFTLKSDVAVSDARGRFRLSRVFPEVDVSVTAQTPDKCLVEATSLHSTGPQELELTVTPDGMVSIVGSVHGSDNREIGHAAVKVVRALLAPNGHTYGSRPIEWNDQRTFPGESSGSFLSPGKVPRFGKYSVTISAPGYLAVETPFLTPPPSGPTLDLGVTKLTKARTAVGIVRDSSGAPVSGAQVWSWAASSNGGRSQAERTTTTTDETGRFTLEKVHPASAVLFVNKEGCRQTGCALRKDAAEITVTLFRADEVIPGESAVHPITLDDARRYAAAASLLNAVLPDQRNYFHGEILSMLARSNPSAARAELAATTSADSRAWTLAQLGEIEDALAEAEGVNDAYSRAYCRLAIVDSIDDPDEVREVLAAALLDAQAIAQPDRRIVVVANVVERFSRLGDQERVATILREELPRAEALSTREWPGFARGYFAAQLARTNPRTALRMASQAPAEDQSRHYQNIAHVVAATNPELAEEALRAIGSHRWVDDPAVRVAYRMALADLPRAIRLVEQIDDGQRPVEKARGLGVIAWAIRKTDPQRARELLRRAFASIPEQHGGGGSPPDDIFGAAVELLRLAEEIDPDRLTDCFWTAASLHPGPIGAAWSPDEAARSDSERQARLALLLALYDATPELPEQIIEPVFEYWEGQIGTDSIRFTDHEGSFIAMALTNPERAADWAARFYQKLDTKHRRYIPQPWEVMGNALTKDRGSIGESITREVFHRWVIDQFDL